MTPSLAVRLRQSRDVLRLTQEQGAALLRVHVATLGRWERGEGAPRPGQLVLIAAAYGVDERWLVTGHGTPGFDLEAPGTALPEEPAGRSGDVIDLLSPPQVPLRHKPTTYPPPDQPLPAKPTADESVWRLHVDPPPHGFRAPFPPERYFLRCHLCGTRAIWPAQFMAHLRSCSPAAGPAVHAKAMLESQVDPAPHQAELARLRFLAASVALAAKKAKRSDPKRRQYQLAAELYKAAFGMHELQRPEAFRIPETWG